MHEIWKVISSSGVYIRENPTSDSKKIDALEYGEYVEAIDKGGYKNQWIKNEKGWICTVLGDKLLMQYQDIPKARLMSSNSSTTMVSIEEDETDATTGYDPFTQPYYISDSSKNGTYDSTYNYSGTIKNINAIHGVPYQFLPNADARLVNGSVTGPSEDNSALGRTYSSKIISKIPLMLLTPGRPDFMSRYSKKDRENILSSVISGVTNINDTNLLSKNGRYYTFRQDHVRYFNYVNPMCRMAAQYLGIGDYIMDGVPFKRYNWGDGSGMDESPSFLKGKLESFLNTGLPGYLAFYINSDTQISESFSNSTSESSLAGTVNGISDFAKELNFILGYSSAATNADTISKIINEHDDINKDIENVTDYVNKLLGGNNFLSSLTTHLATVARGGKLTFPEIWSDSSFSKSYDISIKLISPDSDKLSIYLNVLVPLFHLIGLVAPQSINVNPNGYTSPFLVRAVYKGMFNIDMGIITSMNITKGDESGWTKEGIPTSIEVNFSIKDLYEAMSITSMMDTKKYDTMNNTALMDYIANCCGINIFKPEIARQIDMWYTQHVPAKAGDILYNIFGNLEQAATQGIINLFSKTPFYR